MNKVLLMNPIAVLVLAGLIAATAATAQAPRAVTRINISFKMDPRLSGATYGGERWFSPQTFNSAVQDGTEAVVEALVDAVDAKGKSVPSTPTWTVSAPAMVGVSPFSPGATSHIKIVVKQPGDSKLTVMVGAISKELRVKATAAANGHGLQVAISQ